MTLCVILVLHLLGLAARLASCSDGIRPDSVTARALQQLRQEPNLPRLSSELSLCAPIAKRYLFSKLAVDAYSIIHSPDSDWSGIVVIDLAAEKAPALSTTVFRPDPNTYMTVISVQLAGSRCSATYFYTLQRLAVVLSDNSGHAVVGLDSSPSSTYSQPETVLRRDKIAPILSHPSSARFFQFLDDQWALGSRAREVLARSCLGEDNQGWFVRGRSFLLERKGWLEGVFIKSDAVELFIGIFNGQLYYNIGDDSNAAILFT